MGTPDFAVEPLKAIVENGYDVKGVITVADKPSGRGQKMRKSPVKVFAEENDLNILQPLKLKDPDFLEQLSALKADIFVVIAFRMLPREVWQMPELGTFNIHGSLLPNYRGAAPINWALINGEQKTGVTSFFINEEIDSGSLISNIEVDIADEDNAGTLHDKLMHSASRLVLETLDLISQGNANETKQILDGEEKAAPKIYKEDCLIDWNKPGAEIHNFIRGLSPYPVAWSKLRTESKELGQLRIYKAQFLSDVKDVEFGKVQITKSSMFIGLKDGTLELQEIQWPGKRKMDVKSFLNGFKFEGNLSVLGN